MQIYTQLQSIDTQTHSVKDMYVSVREMTKQLDGLYDCYRES